MMSSTKVISSSNSLGSKSRPSSNAWTFFAHHFESLYFVEASLKWLVQKDAISWRGRGFNINEIEWKSSTLPPDLLLFTYWIWRFSHRNPFHTSILLIRAQVTWTSCSTRSLASSRATFRCGKKTPAPACTSKGEGLVGGWTNPFEKYESKWESSRNGVKITNLCIYIWNHHLDRIWKHNNINKRCLVTFLRELSKKPSLPTS